MEVSVKMNPRQAEAWEYLHDSTTREVLFGGGARWWKSWFGCQWLILEAMSKPWSAWLIGRSELKKLKQTTLLTFFDVIHSLGLKDEIKYNEPMGMIHFKRQDVYIFLVDLSYQPSDPKYNRLGSFSLTWYFIDEAQEVKKDAIDILRARLSLLSGEDSEGNKWETTPKALYTCNPDKGWIYQDFWKPYKNWLLGWERFDGFGKERPEFSRYFIPALVTENTLIPKRDRDEYIANLKMAGKVTVERMLYGNFDYDDTPNRMFNYDCMHSMFTTNEKRRGKKYITCDVSRLWGDMCVIYVWDWYVVEEIVKFKNEKTTYTAEMVRWLAKRYVIPMSRVLVDEDWVGWGIVDNLWCRWFTANLVPISPLSKKYLPEKKRNYFNLKTQCYDILSDRVNNGVISIIDESVREVLLEEMDVMCYVDVDKETKIKITSKDSVKQMIGRSPDFCDCLAMRSFFDLQMTDGDFEQYGIYDPHKWEDMYWHPIGKRDTFIEDWLEELRKPKWNYTAREATSIY